MEQKNYIGLVHKSLTGQLTDTEKADYDAWLNQPENKEVEEELNDLWQLSAAYKPTSFEPNTAKAFQKFKNAIKEEADLTAAPTAKVISINPFYRFARIAAVVGLFAVAMLVFNNYNEDGFNTHLQTASVIENTVLDDGTEIWVDKNSNLLVSNDFGKSERRVQLDGKAYFNVQPDAAKPFIVEMGQNRLEVLGTSFNIDNSSDIVTVEVESGIVKVKTKSSEEVLKVGDVAKLDYSNDKIIISKINEQKFDWYQTPMNINSLPIAEAMDQIGSHFGVNISLAANVDRSCRITSPLMQNVSLNEVFDVLKETHSMKYQKMGEKEFQIQLLSCK